MGTDDGLIHVTRDDGKSWQNITPPAMTAWSKVSQIEAGHFDAGTAYASVDRHRLADDKPYIYRTHDGGKTWRNVVAGIPEGAFVNCVREDTKAKGLLYAATELRVYVSFDDGDHWQTLQLNMPPTSVRDLIVHGDDLAVATHGRGFWVLDQMTALRQIAADGQKIATASAHLFEPGETRAIRVGSLNGTPMPHEEPWLENPPSGVVAYYWLKSAPAKPLKLELVDEGGAVRSCAASDTLVRPVDTETLAVQAIWQQPAQPPSAAAGMHRFSLGETAARGAGGGGGRGANAAPAVPDACMVTDAARGAGRAGRGGAAGLQPGQYTVRLTVDGQTYTQPVTVKPDPRGGAIAAKPRAHFRHPIRMDLELKGKTALVSGSTAGIGLAIATSLAREGVSVIVNGRSQQRVDEAMASSGAAYGVVADLGTVEGVRTVTEKFPAVDILVNNLGIFAPKPFEQIDDADWFHFFEVNVMSGVRLARHYLGGMRQKNWGRIVFISSESAIAIPKEMIHYGMTKTAQLAVSRGLAEATAGTGITVNSVLPGPTKSEGVLRFVDQLAAERGISAEALQREFIQQARPNSLLQRMATVEEVASVVTFVCSPLAAAISGSSVRAEGGIIQTIA